MHGLTLQVRRTVLPRWLNGQSSLTPIGDGEEDRFDTAPRAGKHTVGHNSVATVDVPRESVLATRGNAQPQPPLRGILALEGGDDVKSLPPIAARMGVHANAHPQRSERQSRERVG